MTVLSSTSKIQKFPNVSESLGIRNASSANYRHVGADLRRECESGGSAVMRSLGVKCTRESRDELRPLRRFPCRAR